MIATILKKKTSAQLDYVPVIILAGQSNAVGQVGPPNTAGLPVAYQGEQNNIKIWWEGDYQTYPQPPAFVNMHVPFNTRHRDYTNPTNQYYNLTGYGAEQEASHKLQALTNKDVFVIKNAYGSSIIDFWYQYGAKWYELRNYTLGAINYFKSNNISFKILGLLWVQGESDVYFGRGSTYYTTLADLLTRFRGLAPETANVNWTSVKLVNSYYGPQAQTDLVNAAFDDLAINYPNVGAMDMSEYLVDYADNGHYGPIGVLGMGGKWFDILKTKL